MPPRSRLRKGKFSTQKESPSEVAPVTLTFAPNENSPNQINLKITDPLVKSQRKAKITLPNPNYSKRGRKKIKKDQSEEEFLNSDSNMENFDIISQSDEEDYFLEKNKQESSEELSMNDSSIEEQRLQKLQTTTYLSKRLTKRQKAVLKKSGAEEEKIVSDEDIDFGNNISKKDKKKRKNIMSIEEKTKKIEMEEKRREHLAKVNEQHKLQIVNKILNENKKNKKEKTTEYQRREKLRSERKLENNFGLGDVVVKYSSSSKGNFLSFPKSLSLNNLQSNDMQPHWRELFGVGAAGGITTNLSCII